MLLHLPLDLLDRAVEALLGAEILAVSVELALVGLDEELDMVHRPPSRGFPVEGEGDVDEHLGEELAVPFDELLEAPVEILLLLVVDPAQIAPETDGVHASPPTNGTKRTSATNCSLMPFSDFSILSSFCSYFPTGMTITPGVLSCRMSASGTFSAAAVTMIAS